MGFNFDGYVLRATRNATPNASTSAEPSNGVLRDVRAVPSAPNTYDFSGALVPDFIETYADQYRASVLESPGTTSTEYLIWAANSAQLAWIEDSTWWSEDGTGSIPKGTLQVTDTSPTPPDTGLFYDGTANIVVSDNGRRDLSQIIALVIIRGDIDNYDDNGWTDEEDPYAIPPRKGTNPYPVLTLTDFVARPANGIVTLNPTTLASLDGGLSQDRGDVVHIVRYTLASCRFWWCRNDRYTKHFGFNDRTQRWEPYKGSGPKDLGLLEFDKVYSLTPRILNLPVGALLPADSNSDAYSMIRLGNTPGANSFPVPTIAVKPNNEIVSDYDFSLELSLSGVMGQSNGKLVFNPEFVKSHAGQKVWYVYREFDPEADGFVGELKGADVTSLYIAPIPNSQDHPFIRIGSRRALTPILVNTEADLAALFPPDNYVGVALSTGQIKLSDTDVAKADPTSNLFSKFYLGEKVFYDGVAQNAVPEPIREPVKLTGLGGVDDSIGLRNKLFIPDAISLPDDFASSNFYRGLGRSGVIDAPDGTGSLPKQPGVPASTRPGTDNLGDVTTGRIRQIDSGFCDTVLFSRKGALTTLNVVRAASELPSESKLKAGTSYLSLEYQGANLGAQIALSRADRKKFDGDALYFAQTLFTPAFYTTNAKLVSKYRSIFRFDGTETLHFAIDGNRYSWPAPSGQDFYTPAEVATSIQAVITGTGRAYPFNDYIVLESGTPASGSVEIGFGDGGIKDLSGAAVLGFTPGWRAVGGIDNWLSDSGAALGLARSPFNLDRSTSIPDYAALARVEDYAVQENISSAPFVFLDNPPRQDIAGYDDEIFFRIDTVVTTGDETRIDSRYLEHYEQVLYDFGSRKFSWLDGATQSLAVAQPTQTLNLVKTGVVPGTLLGAPGIGGGLYVAPEGQRYLPYELDNDYILPDGGLSGSAVLVTRYGKLLMSGGLGTYQAGTSFSDIFADFSTAKVGDILKVLTGDEKGAYRVTAVASSTQIEVSPAFLAEYDLPVQWQLRSGYPSSVYDPAVIADITYKPFSHLQTETFKVRLLTLLGVAPTSVVEQTTNRLVADITEASQNGRPIALRYALEAPTVNNTVTITELTKTFLGELVNRKLVIPNSLHSQTGAFAIQVGSVLFVQGTTLLPVVAFSPDPGSNIEYLTAGWTDPNGVVFLKGTLNFGSQILSDLASADVWYNEEFLAPVDLAALQAELDRDTGELNLSESDITTFGGTKVYLTQQLIAEGQKDVGLSPMLGAFSLREPVNKGQVVEAEYYAADAEGRKTGDAIVEFLPVFVSDEIAQRENDATFLFNPNLLTIDQNVDPIVYIGPMLQNFGKTDYSVDYPAALGGQGRIVFQRSMASYVDITVSYAVFEANGGEKSFDATTRPIYRPPFFITANQDKFGVRGNRLLEFSPGQLLRFGGNCFYIRETEYFPPRFETVTTNTGIQIVQKGDITSIKIFPSTITEVGSRSPANDVLMLISSGPVTTVVDPDGATPTPTSAPAGFMQTLDVSTFPFEPVDRGQTTIVFQGNLTQFAVPGHIIEIGGQPYTVAEVQLTADGRGTQIGLTSPALTGFSLDSPPTIKLSYRPIYPPDTRDFLGIGPVASTEDIELILFGETNEQGSLLPGRVLTQGVEYAFDTNSGEIGLLAPVQDALAAGQELVLLHTKTNVLSPFIKDGVLVLPRYYAQFKYVTAPDTENGYLGGRLTATYTYDSPDTFYFEAMPLKTFLGEAAKRAVVEIAYSQPAGGTVRTVPSLNDNENWGRLGLLGDRRYLSNLDRAARTYLDFYNQTIVAFEQIEETISGIVIGDRDGKFRFVLGKGLDIVPPGYEDAITGELNPRMLWSEVFQAAYPSNEIVFTPQDNVVEPQTATLTNSVLGGKFITADRLEDLLKEQVPLIRNDVDDLLFTKLLKAKIVKQTHPPYRKMTSLGVFKKTGEPQLFSRLFPRSAKVFFTTYPGIGGDAEADIPGVYSYARMYNGKKASTYKKPIGQLANGVLGEITQVGKGTLAKRRSRARIWGYYPDGLPAGAFFEADGVTPSLAINEPVIIAVPALLKDIPLNPVTGYPDQYALLSEGGDLTDALTGDPDLSVPGFKQADQIAWGKPSGKTYNAYDKNTPVTVDGLLSYAGVFVDRVAYGCVITFQDSTFTSTPISRENLLVATAINTGTPADAFPIEQGDTLFVVPTAALGALPTDPEAAATAALDDYRIGVDLDIRENGTVIDLSLPSAQDTVFVDVQKILMQNPAKPFTDMEGVVTFVYPSQNPLSIPALVGLNQDDSGDYQLPYVKTANTELERFDQISVTTSRLMTAQDSLGNYVYPDEILGTDGELLAAYSSYKEPATLITTQDMAPVAHGVPDPGIGDLRPYDLLLVEPSTLYPVGIQGILSVGAVSTVLDGGDQKSLIEPPRFVTATNPPTAPPVSLTGSAVKYTFDNAFVYTTPPAAYPVDPQVSLPAGVKIQTVLLPFPLPSTVHLDFSGVGQIVLNDGVTSGVGGLNSIINALTAKNVLTIDIIGRRDPSITLPPAVPPFPWPEGQIVLSIRLEGDGTGTCTGTSTSMFGVIGPLLGLSVTCGTGTADKEILISGAGAAALAQFDVALANPNWFLPYLSVPPALPITKRSIYGYEFSISIDTYNTGVGYSETAYIGTDRLTFNEVVDFRRTRKRGYTHPLNPLLSLEGRLLVHEVKCTNNPLMFSTVNRDINGPSTPFTFLPRSNAPASPPDCIGGTWDPVTLTDTERGSVKVMAFEGYNNTSIATSNVVFSAVPSCDRPEGSAIKICTGTGLTESKNSGIPDADRYDNRVTSISVSTGSVSNVVPGDLLVITKGFYTHQATTKAGTYLVRYAQNSTATPDFERFDLNATVGDGEDWIPYVFPRMVSFNPSTNVLNVTSTQGFAAPPGPRVYIILYTARLNSPDIDTYKYTCISARYTATTPTSFTGLFAYRLADDSVISAQDVADLLAGTSPPIGGFYVSGMKTVTLRLRGAGLPDNSSVVGFHTGTGSIYGFQYLTWYFPITAGAKEFEAPLGDIVVGSTPPAAPPSRIRISDHTPITNTSFDPDPNAVVYPHVPATMSFDLDTTDWELLYNPNGFVNTEIRCLMPGTQIRTAKVSTAQKGFLAQAGIFLEPSFPVSVFDLNASYEHVVDKTHALPITDIGMRDFNAYVVGPAATAPEAVVFEVRRIRRFHGESVTGSNLQALKYAYSVRRGRVTTYARTDSQYTILVAFDFKMDWETTKPLPTLPRAPDVWDDQRTYTGTNLGVFTDPDVNIHTGDILRLLDDYGNVAQEAVIANVENSYSLKLEPPGFMVDPIPGQRFEIYLRQAPVPHEQSCEQLLSLMTDKVVHQTFADEVNELGGYVPDFVPAATWDTVANHLYDDLEIVGATTYATKGVKTGDIVLVDPMGTMPNGEKGKRPRGDRSVLDRIGIHGPGSPGTLDDNRGFYRVTEVHNSYLVVTGESTFTGTLSADVVFPEDSSLRADLGYAVYPTIKLSTLNAAPYVAPPPALPYEGQMDLRPTHIKVGSTYTTLPYSIRPFSYRIIRPSSLFSAEAIDLILSTRERLLSWMEKIQGLLSDWKLGDYFVFQRDEHISDLGSLTDPDAGKGVLSNAFLLSLGGLWGVSPYTNDSDAVSILDRRFWILDRRLDGYVPVNSFQYRKYDPTLPDPVFPDPGGPYTAYSDETVPGSGVLPVLPDRIEEILDSTDRFRALRYTWLAYRTHLSKGTLAVSRQLDAQILAKLEEQKQLLLKQKSLKQS